VILVSKPSRSLEICPQCGKPPVKKETSTCRRCGAELVADFGHGVAPVVQRVGRETFITFQQPEHYLPADTEPSEDKARRFVAPLFCMVLVATIVTDVVINVQSQPDLPSGGTDQPTWALVAFIAGVSVAGLAVLAWRPARANRLALAFTIAMAAVNVLATCPSIALLQSVPVPTYLQHAPGTAATRQARQALGTATTDGTCATVRDDPTGLLPTPYQRCAYLSPPQVDYEYTYFTGDADDVSLYGLIFDPGAQEPGDYTSCVRHLSGPWWAETMTRTIGPWWAKVDLGDGVACASSFKLIPWP
jgi:hypothetical protein